MPKNVRMDETLRQGILAVVSLGCDLETAAAYFKKNSNDIVREIKKNKEFELEIKQARRQAEVYMIKQIKDAAMSEKNWRAATWFLERLRPNKYGKSRPKTYSLEKIVEFVSILTNIVIDEISSEEDKRRIENRFNELLQKLSKNQNINEI